MLNTVSKEKLDLIAEALEMPVGDLLTADEKLDIAIESIKKINEMAQKGLEYNSNTFDDEFIIKDSSKEYKTNKLFEQFKNENFTEDEQKEIANFIKYVISKR